MLGSKVISITEDVYNLLKSMKLKNESFSDVIRRLCQNYTALARKVWCETNPLPETVPDEIWDELEATLEEMRKRPILDRSIRR